MQQQGYSLFELITVMAIVAITASLGVPSFRNIIQNNRISTTTNELLVSISQARAEAIRQNIRVRICSSKNPDAAIPVCSDNNWSSGWAVLADTVGDNSFSTKIAATRIDDKQLSILAGLNTITFNGTGLSEGFNNTSFGICDGRSSNPKHVSDMRNLVISASGRARTAIPEVSGDLNC
ncbi:MAG: GspH/FimT family pseudopilin [Oceanococcus sp.]